MTSYEEAQELEAFDDQLIKDSDFTTEVYFHKLSKQYDFTANGWTSIANKLGVSITEVVRTETDVFHRVDARGTIVVRNNNGEEPREIHRWGGQEQPKIETVKGKDQEDPWAYTNALVKAQRNAYKAHARSDESITQERLKEMYDAQQRKPQTQPAKPVPAVAPTAGVPERVGIPVEPTNNARKAMFATFNEVKALLWADYDINEEVLRKVLYKRFKVESRADMKAHQYVETTAELKKIKINKSMDGSWILEWAAPIIAEMNKSVDGDELPFEEDLPESGKSDWTIDMLKEHANRCFEGRQGELAAIGITKAILYNGSLKHFNVEVFGKKEWVLFTDAIEHGAFPSWVESLQPKQEAV